VTGESATGELPPLTERSVRIRVPATSANLGSGFDALGLALGLHDLLEVSLAEQGLHVTPYAGVPTDERNLVVRALRVAFAATGEQPPGLRVRYTARIPHSRGLGSSSAAICAGVGAGLALRGIDVAGEEALQLAAGLEGHPDNAAPALLGGATIAWYGQGGRVRAVRLEPPPELVPVVFVPSARTSTEASRSALPATVTHRDAAYTAGRAALLVAALSEHLDLLFDATEDRLHQPFRLPAVPASAQLLTALRGAGVPAVLSGSGPSVLALCRGLAEAEQAIAIAGSAASPETGAAPFEVLQPGLDRVGCRLDEDRYGVE
jgi:homoserine kinase